MEYKNEDQPYHTQKVREFRKEHKEMGLCRYCNKEAMAGKSMCEYHLNYYKFYKRFRGKSNGTRNTGKEARRAKGQSK